ncbi:MAG: 2-keto-3-deoxy-galactonokinase, partial [Planctomycetia bacterium]|nr:2-keto-3-deoxy-galactonokinase [Planctomycetia bacterium]
MPSAKPALIGLDWGTSSLRAYLLAGDGNVVERRARPWGIQHLPAGGYPGAFRTIVGDWRERWPDAPVLAAGMVGSRTGWREVPYVECAADAAAIAAGIVPFESECGAIH